MLPLFVEEECHMSTIWYEHYQFLVVLFLFYLQVEEAETIVKLTEELDSIDTGLLEEASKIIKALNKALDNFEMTQLLSGPYDKEGAVINISAGAGGTDAQVGIHCV